MNIFIINTLFFLSLSFSYSFSQDHMQKIIPIFREYIQKSMDAWQVPAVAVGIVYKGKVVFQEAFGVKSLDTKEPVDENTAFSIASCTKTFLAALMAQLVDEGKIKWDDCVRQYLPNFFIGNEEVSQKFTIEDLLSHRSGLPGFAGGTFVDLGFSREESLTALAKIPLKKPFRQAYAYQNQVFAIASLVAEKVTGKNIETLFKERFFDPLNMTNASASYEAMVLKPWWKRLFGNKQNIVGSHSLIRGKITATKVPKELYLFPGTSGINMSISDMNKWVMFQLRNLSQEGGPKISPEQVKRLRTPHIPVLDIKPTDTQFSPKRFSNISYGIGWFIYDFGVEGKKIQGFGHMGAFSSTRSLMFITPQEDLGIVLLCNIGGLRVITLLEGLRDKFLDLFLGIDGEDWSQTNQRIIQDVYKRIEREMAALKVQNPQPSNKMELYQGTFKNDLYGLLSVEYKGGNLTLLIRDKVVPLRHWNGNQFVFDSPELSPAYSSNDLGILEFGFQDGRANLLAINMLHEGDQLFERVGK
jgi:CubicO group peptidase (beta-lactamase class C family)